MTGEEWRPIPGFPGYFVTAEGVVGSAVPRRDGTIKRLKWGTNTSGYPQVHLYPQPRKHFCRPVHVLVALTFLGPRPEGLEVRHLDGNKLNPRVENLRYGTPKENAQDTLRHGMNAMAKKTHCAQGHPFDEANTCRSRQRRCRACARDRAARRRAAARALQAA